MSKTTETLENDDRDALRAYKTYEAFMEQGGTNPPVPRIMQNTLGAIVWTRIAVGQYNGQLTGAFPLNAFFAIITDHADSGANISRVDDDNVSLVTWDNTGTNSDGVLFGALEIRKYLYFFT